MAGPAPAAPFATESPGRVHLTRPDGSVYSVPSGQVDQARTEDSSHVSTEKEYFGAKAGALGAVGAFSTGAVRGASLGLSDLAYVEGARLLGDDQTAESMRHTLGLLKETSPNATLGGELAGTVAGAALLPGGSLGGAALGEGVAARFGTGAAAKFGARALAAAPRAALEGVGIGLGGQLSEDVLENHKFSSEAYLNAGLKGGALGLLMGAGGAGVLGAAGDAAGLAKAKVEALFGRGAARAEEAVGAVAPVGRRVSLSENAEQSLRPALTEEPFTIGKGSHGVGFSAEMPEQPLLTRKWLSSEAIGDFASPIESKPAISSYRRFAEEPRWFEPAGAEPHIITRPGVPVESFTTKKGTFSAVGGNPARTTEREAFQISPTSAPRDVRIGDVGPAGTIEARPGLRIEAPEAPAPATSTGPKTILSRLEELQGSLAEGAAKPKGFPARDVLLGAGQLLSGNPFAAAGHAAAAAQRLYGERAAAHGLAMATRNQTFQRATAKLDELLEEGTKAFVSGKGTSRAAKSVTTEEVRAIREATRSPEAVTARVSEALGDMPKTHPKMAQQIAATATRAAVWLQHALPKESPPMTPRLGGKMPDVPLSNEKRLMARATIETVADGSIVVDRLFDGSLTNEHVAALRYVHPETYAKVQAYLTQHAVELNATLTTQQLFRLSMLFGEPLTEAALPENIRAFQASFVGGNQAPGPGGGGGNVGAATMGGGPVNVGKSRATPNDKLEAGR